MSLTALRQLRGARSLRGILRLPDVCRVLKGIAMERESAIVDRLIRRARRMARTYRTLQVVFIVSGFVCAITWGYVTITLSATPPPTTLAAAYLLIVSFFTVGLAGFGLVAIARWGDADLAKRLLRVVETLARLRKLKAEHPELVMLNEVTEVLEDEKTELTNRRSFWVNIAVNIVFTLLGFALSYTATKLGWLR